MKKRFIFLILFFSSILMSCSFKTAQCTITYYTYPEIETTIKETYDKNHKLENISLPILKEGYAIEGWYLDSNFINKVSFPYIINEDTAFYAKWVKLHKITFIVNNEVYDTEEIMEEYSLKPKEAPTINGGTFINWYIDSNFQIPYDFDSKVYSDFTLYAKYEMSNIVVSYMLDSSLLEKQTISYNSLASAPVAPSKEGFTFKGWSLQKDTFEEFDFETPLLKDTTLYAYYEEVKRNYHTVTLWIDGTKTAFEVENGKTIDPMNLPKKEGYLLKELYEDELKTNLFNFNTIIEEDITLYGSFEILTYTIEYYIDNKLYSTLTKNYNTFAEAILAPKKTGYSFKGWSSSDKDYKAFDFTTPIHENLKLYAYYEINKYTVTYYIESEPFTSIFVNYNKVAENKTAPKKEGYSFKGWSKNASKFEPFDFNTKIQENINLFAFYEIAKLNVTFVEDNNSTVLTTEYNSTISSIKASSKEGYTFKGWSLKQNVYEAFDFTTPIIEDITLYAYYVANEYTITFIDEDMQYYTCKAPYNTTISFPEDPIKSGYVFKGWSTNKTEYIAFTEDSKILKDISLYAFYIEEIIVTLVVDTTQTTIKVGLGELMAVPEPPKKEGFQFLGWYLDDELYDFTTPVTESLTLIAKFSEVQIDIQSCGGYSEGFYFEAKPVPNSSATDYNVSYRKKNASVWESVDPALIRLENNLIRCDAVGLEAGNYEVHIEVFEKSASFTCIVSSYDRSGYAHFNSSTGIGGYNNNGTLKTNAVVVYVTDQNKNTVTAKLGSKTFTGLSEILQNQNGSVPLVIRIIGTISAATWNKIDYKVNGVTSITPSQVVGANQKVLSLKNYEESELISGGFNSLTDDINAGITKLNGLTNRIKYDPSKEEFDSYYNMLDISGAKNVTVEGIGTSAKLYQWGFTWKNSSSIEIRNLSFDDYTEDACSFEGSDDSSTLDGFKTGHIWIHHNTFNEGKNNWDVCNEQDKHEGDGATDFKKNAYITVAYNHYYKNHKTGLVGGSDSQHTACVTFHHNFYDQCTSRLPLGRQANMHMYNNYYYKSSGTNMSIRANGYALVENCVFENVNNPFEVKSTAAIKSYNNILTGCKGLNQATVVNSRTEKIDNSNPYGTDFDTNSSIFYYNATKKVSDVEILHETSEVKEYCKLYAGVLKNSTTNSGDSSETNPNPPEQPENWEMVLNEDFSIAPTITQIPNGTLPTEKGFYYSYTAEGTQESNNISVSNGALNIVDTSTTATTYGYYILEPTSEIKKLKISLDFTPQTANGKWTPIHFLDGQENLGIRTSDDKYLGYTLDNGVSHIKVLSSTITAKVTYHIELIIDYTNQCTTIQIDSSNMEINNYSPIIKGIMFQTATAARSFSVDNLKISVFN